MFENTESNFSGTNEESFALTAEYLNRAQAACDQGDVALGVYLYLAAFEEANATQTAPSEAALAGLKQAWALACGSKERSLAEYIFEKMEPYLSEAEIALCADELQDLAFGKLEEFGLSREELEDMASMISQDIFGLDAPVVQVEHIVKTPKGQAGLPSGAPSFAVTARVCDKNQNQNSTDEPDELEFDDAALLQEADIITSLKESLNDALARAKQAAPNQKKALAKSSKSKVSTKDDTNINDYDFGTSSERLTYATVAGYRNTISTMRDLGIGMSGDADFQELVSLLNARHGLDRMPALDAMLFRAPAREDANRFIAATLGELNVPVLRMHMEENMQGIPVLCVMAQASDVSRPGNLRTVFENGGALVLEDLDLWASPMGDISDDMNGFLMMQLSRGAHEAINLIRYAVENPDVYVFASASSTCDVNPFFLEVLEPLSVIDIENPTPEERVEIWMDIAKTHPSIRSINRSDLVRFSANMPRFDMYMAVRDAIEEAYKVGLMNRHYQAVSAQNLFDKLANYQPLESNEYSELEDAVINEFRNDIENLEDLLGEDVS